VASHPLSAVALVVVPTLCGPQYWHALVNGEKHALHWGHCQPCIGVLGVLGVLTSAGDA